MADPCCPSCRQPFPVGPFLQGALYSPEMGCGQAPCPRCHATIEFNVGDGMLELGYTYAAGTVHFCGMEQIPVPGLRSTRSETSLDLELDGVLIQLPLHRPR